MKEAQPSTASIAIIEAESEAEFVEARRLFEEYAANLGVDLCFQNFATELETIQEMYRPPGGCVLLARHQDTIVGCVALRPHHEDVCEMKRLYVRPAARGLGAGRRLAVEVMRRARAIGYQRMVLDTLESLRAARSLYASLGFREVAPYYANPLEGVVYMEFDLQRAGEPGKTATYIHGTRPEEQERLALLNDLTNKAFLEFLDVQPGSHVLDVGSGLGLLADGAASSAPSVRVTGLEKSFAQISAATKAAAVAYVQGDAAMLPFGDRCFDLACARYVLEHVADPEGVLREMRRVTRTGGRVAVCENDESLIRMDPVCPAFQQVWNAFQNYQSRLGGDSHIGSRLYRLFRSAGFSKIELSVQPEVHWYGKPTLSPWVRNIIGNIESARAGLIDSGMCSRAQIDEAVAELGALLDNTHASSVFVWNRAMAEA